jgi:hypothetical protein
MGGLGQPAVERLREFLRELKPGARALLIAELERSLLRGDDVAGAELILTELRRSFRDSGAKALRIGDHARLFFQPLEPFLVDDARDHNHRGRVARAALEPIWRWISNTVMPEEARRFSDQVEQALLANDSAAAEELACAFQDRAVQHMQAAINQVAHDAKARGRLAVQLGTPRALEDVQAVIGVLKARDGLAVLGRKLHGHIKTLSGWALDGVKELLDSPVASHPDVFLYALVLVMSRMAAPWQLIRLATKAAGSDDAARIAEHPYGLAVTIVLAEIERMVGELGNDLKSGRGIAVVALLKDVHDAVRGLRSELDLSGDGPWARQLAAIRADISNLLSAEIELMPGRVRRLMRPRPAKDIRPGAVIERSDVEEVEILIGFAVACRNYASELAINEVSQRTFAELQQCLDTGTHGLLDALRAATDHERSFRRSHVEAAVRFCAKVFGQEYASLLAKAAEVASAGGERKVAAAAKA